MNTELLVCETSTVNFAWQQLPPELTTVVDCRHTSCIAHKYLFHRIRGVGSSEDSFFTERV